MHLYRCTCKRFKADDIQKPHLLLAHDVSPSVTLTTNAGLPIHYNLKTSPIYLNYFKMHSKIMVFVEMRSWGCRGMVEKAEGVSWLQLAHCNYGICQAAEEKVSPILPEPEAHFWKNGQENSHYWDLIAWDSKDDGLFCFPSNLGYLLL